MKQMFLLVSMVGFLATFNACGGSDSAPSCPPVDGGPSSITTLQSVDVVVGAGAVATAGRTVSVHYTGWLYSQTAADHHGTKFDSSRDRNQPFAFALGAGQVIPGWDQGVAGMKVGGQRTLTIPPSLAYQGVGSGCAIPPNATLVFDVELLAVN